MNWSNTTTISPTLGLTKEERCDAPLQTNSIIQASVLILIMIVTFIGNLLVLLAVIFFRRLRSMTNYFIFSLAVSDLLIAVLSLPFRINQTFHLQWCSRMATCQTWLIIDSACAYASMWNLMMISIDRYIVIKKPFRYHSIMTNKVGFGLIAVVWTYSIVMALFMLLNWTNPGKPHFKIDYECSNNDKYYYTAAASLSFFLPLLIIVIMYGMVFEVALNQTRAMAALQVDRDNSRGIGNSINLIREVKAAKTLAVVIGCFVICWMPFEIILMILLWSKKLIFLLPPKVRQFLSMTFIYLLPNLNSTMNPIIYALLNREFRSAFGKLFKRMTGRHLGAVGFNGTLESTTGMGASHAEQISDAKDHDSKMSDNSPACPSEDLLLHNTHSNKNDLTPVDNYMMVNTDTNSMETSLDDSKRKSVDNNIYGDTSNGHVITNLNGNSDVVSYDDVIDKQQVSNDATSCDDVTEKKGENTDNAVAHSPKRSPKASKVISGTLPSVAKADTLSPVEQNIPTENDERVVSSVEGVKSVTVQPSPKLTMKGDAGNINNLDADNSTEITFEGDHNTTTL